jgi:hypothetical protein
MFKHPCTVLVAGPTSCGKTTFVKDLILSDNLQPPPEEIYWIYNEHQPALVSALGHKVQFLEGVPEELEDIVRRPCRKLVVLDDSMNEIEKDVRISKLYTRGSHHNDTSVIVVVQNLFHQGKCMRNISLNSHYICLFKNPREVGQITRLASQMYTPNLRHFMVDAFKKATSKPHGYLLCDLRPETEELQRLKANVMDDYPTVFVPQTSINTAQM